MMDESKTVPPQEQEIKHLPIHEVWEVESSEWLPNDQYSETEIGTKLRDIINPSSTRLDTLLKNITDNWITDHDELDNYKVAFEEALINALKYGNGDAETRTAHVEIDMDSDKLIISVRDNNTQPFDYQAALAEADNPDNLLLGRGRGLVMMNAYFGGNVTVEHVLSKDSNAKNEGNKIIMTKLRPKG